MTVIYDTFEELWAFANRYDIIVNDPPWTFGNANITRACGCREKADYHYKSYMTLKQIKDMPVHLISAPVSCMFLWSTGAHLDFALECLKHWGFKYSGVCFTWIKTKNGKVTKNVGPWTMKGCEFCLLGTKGKANSTLLKVRNTADVLFSERGGHSEKPDLLYTNLENMFPGTKRIDLFARKERPGWDAFGDEVKERID
jgi:N6-adenosine-specific RNA methylase IME4